MYSPAQFQLWLHIALISILSGSEYMFTICLKDVYAMSISRWFTEILKCCQDRQKQVSLNRNTAVHQDWSRNDFRHWTLSTFDLDPFQGWIMQERLLSFTYCLTVCERISQLAIPAYVIRYVCYAVGCLYNAVQYNMILHTSMQLLKPNINQSFSTQKTPHISP